MFLLVSMPLGRICGIPIRIHWSAPAGIIIMAAVGWPDFAAREGRAAAMQLAANFGVIAAIALMVLIHELAHSLTAKIWGVRTQGIYLHIFGGVALVKDPNMMTLSPWKHIAILGTGPASNIAISLIAASIAFSIHHYISTRILLAFAAMNLGMGIFNLLPIWPLDGGQIFREFMRLTRLRTRFADWIALTASLLIGVPFMYAAWANDSIWTFTVLLILSTFAIIVLGLYGYDPGMQNTVEPGTLENQDPTKQS